MAHFLKKKSAVRIQLPPILFTVNLIEKMKKYKKRTAMAQFFIKG